MNTTTSSSPTIGEFVCCECGGKNLVSDAACKWSIKDQDWVKVGEVMDDTYCQDCERNVRINFNTLKSPEQGQIWRHHSGREYAILLLANEDSTNPDYVLTIIYQGVNGKVWTRPASDWHRAFTYVGQVPS